MNKIIKPIKILLIIIFVIFTFQLIGCKDEEEPIPVDPPKPIDPIIEEKYYSINFVTNSDDSLEILKVKVEDNKPTKVTLPTPTKTGYIFLGWFSDPEFFYSSKVSNSITLTGDITIYADWIENGYTIQFEDSGDKELENKYFLFNEEIVLPTPTKTNYKFIGWYYNDKPFTLEKMPAYDLSLEARWELCYYQVKFHANDGSFYIDGAFSNQTNELTIPQVLSGNIIDLPIIKKEGSFFKGWYTSLEGTGAKFSKSSTVVSDLNLYAMWEPLSFYEENYKIKYDLNGGNFTEQIVDSYQTGGYTELKYPVKPGYDFIGFYQNEYFLGNKIETILPSDFGDYMLYAKFNEIKESYTVKYYDYQKNILTTKTYDKGSLVENIEIPQTGIISFSWFLYNAPFDFNTPIESDLELNAKWSVVEDYLDTLIPSVVDTDVDLLTRVATEYGTMSILWDSSDPYTLSNIGFIYQARVDTLITMKATFILNGERFTHEYEVVVPAIKFRDLSRHQAVFGYLYSNISTFKLTDAGYKTIDVLNYSFARTTTSGSVSIDELTRISEVLKVRKDGVRVVFSIGGYGEGPATLFANAASTPEGCEKYANEIVDIIEKYHFDGVDIDWEYPGFGPYGTAVEKEYFTNLITAINKKVKAANPDYLVTSAIPGGPWVTNRFDLRKLNNLLDYFHIMTYDLQSSGIVSHHTALYKSSYTISGCSVDESVKLYMENGVDSKKLIVGIAFYGHSYVLNYKLDDNDTIGGMGSYNFIEGNNITYTKISNIYFSRSKKYYDNVAQAPYLYDPYTRTVISYDDPRSIKAKCNYAINNSLGGVMFWDYGEDSTGTLVEAIYINLRSIDEN